MTGRFTSSRGAIVECFAVLSRENLGDSEWLHKSLRILAPNAETNTTTLRVNEAPGKILCAK